MGNLRFKAVEEAFRKKAVPVSAPANNLDEYYGKYVFNKKAMSRYLQPDIVQAIGDAVQHGKTLDANVADIVASAMKRWAKELGATHYTHWFQPLTEGTAQKHESFIEYDGEPGDKVIESFSGKLLVQQESDASSFPNGGTRSTFEARGYTAWDPSSPAFVMGDTLCIPTIFISYTGDTLDMKAPLLKSLSAVNKAATEVCRMFDANVDHVVSYLGWEQEYFLVDEGLYATRPDLMITGRTLLGHLSAKNQQLEDHYFGAIPSRVTEFMKDLEFEAYKYAIPLKTRHNEVAPNQFELAPIYGETNLSVDQNLIVMSLMKRVARRHGFRVLFHEKPFAGVNGSGKHCNWSLGTNTGVGLFTPGKTAAQNLQFVTFLVNALTAVYKHNALLKASIASATNSHRLGANEAPPAIISVFLGKQMSEVLETIAGATSEQAIVLDEKKKMSLGIAHIPEVLLDNTDRNRTSPFAFTGNRFEFRAVGSSASCSSALIALNSVMAEQLLQFKADVDTLLAKGKTLQQAIFDVLKEYIAVSRPVHFEGNGYSDEWQQEACKRGLDCETSVPEIFKAYTSEQSVKMFEHLGVFSKAELHARNEVKWETYTKKLQIEERMLADLTVNHIIPIALRYQNMLLDSVTKYQIAFPNRDKSSSLEAQLTDQIANHTTSLFALVKEMNEAAAAAAACAEGYEMAKAYHDSVLPYFAKIRSHADALELIVDDEMWTLPKYRELLFIH